MRLAGLPRGVTGEHYRFDCASCGEQFRTDAEMRTLLIDEGCVFCGARVTEGEFSPA